MFRILIEGPELVPDAVNPVPIGAVSERAS